MSIPAFDRAVASWSLRTIACIALMVMASQIVRAEHFDIRLLVAARNVTEQAFADPAPPAGGINPRPVLKARAGDRITMQFIMTNVFPHEVAKNAGVHYFVVREQTIGQRAVAALTGDVVTEGRLAFDLKPQARIGTRQQIVIRRPGNYLLRVESERTQREHEHFAAIDLQVEGGGCSPSPRSCWPSPAPSPPMGPCRHSSLYQRGPATFPRSVLEKAKLPPAWEAMSLAAAGAVAAEYAGLDLLETTSGEVYVLEVNGIPGWRGLQETTDVDVAGAIVQQLDEIAGA